MHSRRGGVIVVDRVDVKAKLLHGGGARRRFLPEQLATVRATQRASTKLQGLDRDNKRPGSNSDGGRDLTCGLAPRLQTRPPFRVTRCRKRRGEGIHIHQGVERQRPFRSFSPAKRWRDRLSEVSQHVRARLRG